MHHRVCFPHGPQVPHELGGAGVVQLEFIQVHGRHCQVGPGEQVAGVADLCQRRDDRRDSAEDLHLGQGARDAQLVQRLTAEQRRQHQAVGFEGEAALRHCRLGAQGGFVKARGGIEGLGCGGGRSERWKEAWMLGEVVC